jgi:hypothetical protein
MAMRLVVVFVVVAVLLSGGGIASAAPRYSDWSGITYFSMVNTSELEFANAISKDGLTFYFQRGNALSTDPALREDLWISQRTSEKSAWGTPTRLPATVNSTANERAAFESPDGHWLFFASDRAGGTDFDIYVSWRQHTHDAAGWQAPVKIDALSTAGFDSGPSVFEDDATGSLQMYLVSNPTGPQNAGVDIYQSSQGADGSWAAPQRVDELNSAFAEGRPYIRHDGLEIFFNSARPGAGLTDIWFATRGSPSETWSAPQLAPGINTAFAENIPALSWDGRTLYFSSNRSGTQGEIYFATREKVTGKP